MSPLAHPLRAAVHCAGDGAVERRSPILALRATPKSDRDSPLSLPLWPAYDDSICNQDEWFSSLTFGLVGYAFGHLMELILADVRKYELWIALGLFVSGSAAGFYHWLKRRGK